MGIAKIQKVTLCFYSTHGHWGEFSVQNAKNDGFLATKKGKVHSIVSEQHRSRSISNDLEVEERVEGGYISSSRDTSVDLENNYRQVRLQFLFYERLDTNVHRCGLRKKRRMNN